MQIKCYTKKDFKTSSWSGGKTTELLIFPPSASYAKRDFSLRLSSATVDVPISHFTNLPGITRFITPLSYPFLLEIDTKRTFLLSPFQIFKFSGESCTYSYGMSRDFNLMINEKTNIKAWMKASNCEKEISIEDAEKATVWLFNFFQTLHISIDNCEYEMDSFSLLTIKCEKERKINIKLKEATRLIYGAFC